MFGFGVRAASSLLRYGDATPTWPLVVRTWYAESVSRIGVIATVALYARVAAQRAAQRGRRRRIIRRIAVGVGLGLIAHAVLPFWYQVGGGAVLGLASPGLALALPLGIAAPAVGVPAILVGGAGVASAIGVSLPRAAESVATVSFHRGLVHGSRLFLGVGIGLVIGVSIGLFD